MTVQVLRATDEVLPPTTVKTYCLTALRSAIISGKFRPGDRLNESELARQYGVSRIPVREALQQLHEQGLVTNHPRRGMFVTSLSEEDCQKINSLRIILEAEALKLCRARFTAACERELLRIVEQMDKRSSGSEMDAATLDLEFHRTIWHNSGNSYLEKTLSSLVPVLFAHQALEYISHDLARWPLNHHRQLLAIVQGTSEQTPEDAMISHLRVRYTNPERFSSLAYRSTEA